MTNTKTDWMNSKWRSSMAWLYMAVCAFDFIVFPILWSIIQAYAHGSVQTQWQPLTLQGAGLFHIAMGTVIGISAYGRTQEKINGVFTADVPLSYGPGLGTTYQSPIAPTATPPAATASTAPVTQPGSYGPDPDPTANTPPARRSK